MIYVVFMHVQAPKRVANLAPTGAQWWCTPLGTCVPIKYAYLLVVPSWHL